MPTLSTTAFESLCRIIRNYRAAGKYIMAVKVYEDYACYMTQEQLREAHRTLWNNKRKKTHVYPNASNG